MRLGLGLHVRLVGLWHSLLRWRRQRARHPLIRHRADKLHIGSGPLVREGWTNVDIQYHAGIEFVLDVRDGLPFQDVQYILAEHFLEHLTFDEGFRFLKECRNVLRPTGVLRLSTPNLRWVLETQYHSDSTDLIHDCFAINKAFRGWGHQFLYDVETLEEALRSAGFAEVTRCRYGESADPELRGLEKHSRDVDSDALPHVVIVEARGAARARNKSLDLALEDYDLAY